MYSKGWSKEVLSSYSEKDPDSGTYDNRDWVEKQKKRVTNISEEIEISIKRNKLLIEEVEKIKNKELCILDIGGGFGLSYLPLRESTKKSLDYNIVEVSRVVEAASSFFKDHGELSFFEKISRVEKEIDLCYIRTSLQYVDNWKKTLEEICDKNPRTIVLSDTAAGPINTFLTYQFWGEEKIPYWFINSKELISLIESKGYQCTRNEVAQDITKNKSFDGLKNYPKENRIETLLNLVFEKNEDK